MAGIKIDPEMLDIYLESLNKLMAGSETDGGNARLEVSGAGKTEDGLVRYNEEVNKLGDDLRELYGNVGEILGRIRDGTLFKNADKVSVVAGSTDGAGVLAKHTDETGAWLHGVKVFRYSDATAEAVASGEKLLKESGTIYESFADMMSPDDATKYLDFLENGSKEGLTSAELAGVEKADALLVSQKVGYEDVWDLRNVGDALESGKYSAFGEMSEADGVRYRDWNYQKIHEISIHNPNAGSMTLGKYFDGTIESGSYVARAELTGDTYFSLGTQWNDITKAYGLSDKEMFNLFNTRALDDAVRQGKSIRFSQNPLEWKGTALGDEWLYLQSKHGYTRLKKIGDYWYAK